jgi:isopentenyl-diphosphate delta-isomerase
MTEPESRTGSRKAEHLRINLQEDVQSAVATGLEGWRFVPRALPELDLGEVRMDVDFLGHRLKAPFLVSCMTGGTPEAADINRVLAGVAEHCGFALGLGSGRALLEDPTALASFDVRDLSPSVPLLANLGAVQLLRGVDAATCTRLVELLRADALVLHLNAVQEALQAGGDVSFRGVLRAIEALCRALPVPVVVKEVGWGIPPDDAKRLCDAGVAAIDVAGAGGTSWSEVERRRHNGGRARVAAAFRDWGLPTAEAIRRARAALPDAVIVGSGGIRDGVEAAKALALGANIVGLASPFLKTAGESERDAMEFGVDLVETLRLVMFAVGVRDVGELRGSPRLERVTP